MFRNPFLPSWCLPVLIGLLGALLTACTGSAPRESVQVLPTPTMPVARFTPVAGEMNEAAAEETKEQIQATAVAIQGDIEAGQRVYANRCAECHGAERQGTDAGSALTSLDMTMDDFIIFLRTGGDLGNDHLFGTTKVSNPGLEALFAYLTTVAPN